MAQRVLAWFGVAVACSCFGGCAKTDDAEPVSREQLVPALVGAICDSLGACCKTKSFGFDAQTCRTGLAAKLNQGWGEYDPVNVTYDAQAAGGCLKGIASALDCGEGLEDADNAECDKVFKGKLAAGATCKSSVECARPANGSAYCLVNSDTMTGVCTQDRESAHGKAGQACGSTCSGDACFSAPALGDTGAAKVFCYQKEGLYCAFEGTSSTCKPLVGLDQACAGDYDACQKGSFCDQATRLCAAPRENGQPCESSSACRSNHCDETRICADRVTAALCQSAGVDGGSAPK